jgi:hypothetical protein
MAYLTRHDLGARMSEKSFVLELDENVRLVKVLDNKVLLYCFGKTTSPTCYRVVLSDKPRVEKLPDEEARRIVEEEIRHARERMYETAERIARDVEELMRSMFRLMRDVVYSLRELREELLRLRV